MQRFLQLNFMFISFFELLTAKLAERVSIKIEIQQKMLTYL